MRKIRKLKFGFGRKMTVEKHTTKAIFELANKLDEVIERINTKGRS